MNAPTLRDLLQWGIDRRAAQLLPTDYRALENAVREEERVRPRGLSLNRTTISQILKGNYRGEASDGTIRAIGWLAGVADKVAFTAAGHQPQGLPFASELPQGVDDLTAPERRAALDMLRVLVAQRQEINRHEHAEDLDPSSKPDASTKGHKAKEAGNVLRPAHWNKAPLPPTVAQADAASEGLKHSDTEGAGGTLSHYVALAREIFQDLADIDPSLDMREQAFSLERLIEPGSSLVAHSAYISSIGAMLDRARERLIEFAVKQPSAKKQAAAMIERLEAHANLAPVDS
ncbi:hypothetical protein BKG71_03740 [Mycobacteroides chelonae]|uniref:hypothetical protein n=1 Tax=Mycobacteroides chelonae TaxID=1774 RepID=UPI0008AA05F7|nr:hypothetical protein [Mycobacteroides chelonae]MBF9523094.1 hypothetical protein [Mycobacteroides chelonae]OHU02558.1 hypothetical protein BKG71_03740 [Mycobacteroides chelonae]